MKRLLTILFLIPLFTFAQDNTKKKPVIPFPRDSSNNEITFTEVVKVDSATAEQLYKRAELFVAQAYNSGKDVSQLNDEYTHTMLLKPVIELEVLGKEENKKYSGYANYEFKIESKDNRYRYTINHFFYFSRGAGISQYLPVSLSQPKPSYIPDSVWFQLQTELLIQMKQLVERFKQQMAAKPSDF